MIVHVSSRESIQALDPELIREPQISQAKLGVRSNIVPVLAIAENHVRRFARGSQSIALRAENFTHQTFERVLPSHDSLVRFADGSIKR